MLTQRKLKELLHYDPTTGCFTWRVSRGRVRVGDAAGSINKEGYRRIKLLGESYLASRLAVLYVEGVWPTNTIDHENITPGDDRWCNLRHADQALQSQNRRVFRNNKSGHTGVWQRRRGGWIAHIARAGKRRHLGIFRTKEEAVAARLRAEAESP